MVVTILSLIIGFITAFGVVIAAFQLRWSRKLAQISFEDSLSKEYRSLALDIPVDVLMGKNVNGNDFKKIRELIYNYIDLSNEQVFLRSKNRITENTWWDWAEGIEANLRKPVFKLVWSEIKESSTEIFLELRKLENDNFNYDPKSWKQKKR